MRKAAIVDDNFWVIEGIEKSFDWSRLDITEIIKINNPRSAAATILAENPDVVFIDMDLGIITGIDVMRECRQNGFAGCFVVVSGFDDFTFAKDSMEYGAIYYMLKPLDEDSIELVTKKLFDALNLNDERTSLSSISSMLENESHIKALFEREKLEYIGGKRIIILENGKKYKTSAFSFSFPSVVVRIGGIRFMMITNAVFEEKLDDNLNELERFARLKDFTAGVSRPFDNFEDISNKYLEAYCCFLSKYIHSGRHMFVYINKTAVTHKINEFKSALKLGGMNAATNIIRGLPDYFRESGFMLSDALFLFNQIISLISYEGILDEFEFEYINAYSFEEQYGSIERIVGEICSILIDNQGKTAASGVSSGIASILAFIDENYNSSICLDDLSQKFHYSINYICKLFKTSVNMTFTEYITAKRIESACALIKENRLSITEIADKVGYNDYFYFNKAFKKITGLTPKQYRNKY